MDLGRTILIDDETGDPYVDPDGNLVMIGEEQLLRQSMDVLLHTFLQDDLFALNYGFDYVGVVQGLYGHNVQTSIEIAIAEAFERESEPLFKHLKWVQVVPQGDYTALVKVAVVCATEIDVETIIEVEY